MKYETGLTDQYGNRQFDWVKVCKDMKRVVQGKIKFSKALYEVMSLRFTIAHYDRKNWLYTYNGNWDLLAKQIGTAKACPGDLKISEEEANAIYDLRNFLFKNADAKAQEDL